MRRYRGHYAFSEQGLWDSSDKYSVFSVPSGVKIVSEKQEIAWTRLN
jgi:hypothetical protein